MDSEPAKNRDSDPAKDMDSDPAKDNGSERIRNRSTVPNNRMIVKIYTVQQKRFFLLLIFYISLLYTSLNSLPILGIRTMI